MDQDENTSHRARDWHSLMSEYISIDSLNLELSKDMGDLADDPLECVRYLWPWGRGPLANWSGPDVWQEGFLREWGEDIRARDFDGFTPVMPIMTTTTSGHGVGKSALVAMIVGVIMSTRPHCRGRITANSIPQLSTTTWPEIVKWADMMLTRHWFRITSGSGAMKMIHGKHPDTWRTEGIAWDATRPAAFAGKHAADSTTFYVIDEASEVARSVLETAQGGLTDGEPMFFMFSNPTKPTGFFYDSHHDMRKRFRVYKIDSRTAKMTNKELIAQWLEDWGVDSDFFKVRVLGEFPTTGDRQFIPTQLVDAAMDPLRAPYAGITDPVIIGVDVARFGDDETTIYVRRGRDARSIPPIIIKGQDTVKTAFEVKRLALDLLADAVNVDGGGVGGGVIDNLRAWQVPNVNEINFGGTSPDTDYHLMNSYMVGETRKWLMQQGVCLPVDDKVLRRQLTVRKYGFRQSPKGTQIQVQSKEELKDDEDIKESPDRADGLGLTFAVPLLVRNPDKTRAALAGEAFSSVVGEDYSR